MPAEHPPKPQPTFVGGGGDGRFTAVADYGEGEEPESLREKALIFAAFWSMNGVLPSTVDPGDVEKLKEVVARYLEPAQVTDECKQYLAQVWADAVKEGIVPDELIPLEDLGIVVVPAEGQDIKLKKGGFPMGIFDGRVSWEMLERKLLSKHYEDNYRQQLRIADLEWEQVRGFSDRWQAAIMARYS